MARCALGRELVCAVIGGIPPNQKNTDAVARHAALVGMGTQGISSGCRLISEVLIQSLGLYPLFHDAVSSVQHRMLMVR